MNGAVDGNGRAEGNGEGLSVVARGGARSVAPACVAVYLAVVLGLLVAIFDRDRGVFTYTLDDPYIHLALAQSLAHGHYGINAGEASSPSSSVVWPFLLTPFAGWAWGVYLPLAWNVVFCGMAAWGIGRFVDGWRERAGWAERFAVACALMLVGNLAGLTFVGMEHGLQVLLAIACAVGMAEAYRGRVVPGWCLCAAALGPMVRYENFALVVAVGIALCGQGRVRGAVRLVAVSLVGPVLFSVLLVSRGLPALPTSVLVKARVYAVAGSAASEVMRTPVVREWTWWGLLAVLGVLVWLAVREKERRWVLAGTMVAAVLQLAAGRFNWFHRYEVYAVVFCAMVAAMALVERVHAPVWGVTLGLLVLAWPYEQAVWETPAAASNVYEQQWQMGRFEREFYGKTVAVNDLGSVSYRRPSGADVVDLWGLGSPEAARQAVKDGDWMDAITQAHGAGLAMIYPDWFDEGAPDDWTPLATMCIAGERVSVSRECVVFYSTEVGDRAALTAEVAAFARTLPSEVRMTLGRDSTDEDE
ncbi:MAG: hypothetical protein ABR910_14400 [Acidobacteriaceae bacterium]